MQEQAPPKTPIFFLSGGEFRQKNPSFVPSASFAKNILNQKLPLLEGHFLSRNNYKKKKKQEKTGWL